MIDGERIAELFERFVEHFDRRLDDHSTIKVLEANMANHNEKLEASDRRLDGIDRRIWWILSTTIATFLGIATLVAGEVLAKGLSH